MSRSKRLLDLIQILRSHRRPVSGRTLAADLGISMADPDGHRIRLIAPNDPGKGT